MFVQSVQETLHRYIATEALVHSYKRVPGNINKFIVFIVIKICIEIFKFDTDKSECPM